MKDHLDEESRQAIIKYRIEKSQEALDEAKLLAESSHFDSAVTRLYYACYYLACALLIKNNVEASSHAGVKRMFSLKFVQTGILEQKYSRIFANLMQGRQLSDYEDFIYQNQESFSKYETLAKDFCDKIKSLI